MRLLTLTVLLVFAHQATAQLRLSALSEGQLGDFPNGDGAELRTIYNQVTADWQHRGWHLGLRTESFYSSVSGRSYTTIQQRSAGFDYGDIALRAGHFYAIAGSGLLAHAFELPGVISEDRGSRRRYQIVRDLDGVFGRWRRDHVDLQVWHGTPVNSGLPPALDGVDRRQGTIQGGTLLVRPHPVAEIGAGLLEFSDDDNSDLGATTFLRLRPAVLVQRLQQADIDLELYGEYAQRDLAADRWFSAAANLAHALYLSSSFTVGALGLSVEYKDYRDFQLAEVNNPPTLIREHQAYLLNRITHDILADDESGIQSELVYAFANGQQITANYTRASRRLEPGGDDDLQLWEVFLQLDTPLGTSADGQIFVDMSRNRILADEDRRSGGLLVNFYPESSWSLSADLEFQDVNRRFGTALFPYENLYFSAELSRASWSWALTLQRSNDTLENGAALEGATYWWGLNTNWQISPTHSASLFAGKRRFGLACTGGTCYEVLGFAGVELRLFNQLR